MPHRPPVTDKNTHTRQYPDGAVIAYDHAQHILTALLPDGASVALTAPQSVTVNTSQATVVANTVLLDAGQTTCNGNLTVKGNINATGDVMASNISLKNHTHIEQGDGKPVSKPQ